MDVHYTLRQLEYFVAVAHTGTVSEAAHRCHVSQPALSLAITQLERSLGLQLLLRHRSRGAELTPAGTRVLTLAQSLLGQAAALQESAGAENGGLSGSLAVGCYTTLAPTFVPPLLTGFKAQCPAVALEFTEYAQPELLRDLERGMVELALLYDRQLDPGLASTEIGRLYPYVLLPAAHPFAADAVVSLTALAAEPTIVFDVPPSRENWQEIIASLGIEPVVGHRTRNFELARCLVGRGLGYSLLYQRPPLDITYEGRPVVAKPIAEQVPALRVVLAYPAGTNLTARARRFAEYAASASTGPAPAGPAPAGPAPREVPHLPG
jgi:DNA-binding transcriptional LysR family regulator